MNRTLKLALALAPFALGLACTDPVKAPAEKAVAAAEAAVATLTADAEKWAPEQSRAAKDALAKAKDLVAKSDFKGALAAAGAIPGQVKEALAAAAAKAQAAAEEEAKKLELTKAWEAATASLPNLIETAKSRLAILSQAKKLPAGLDKAKLARAKEGLAVVDATFQKATADFKAGAMAEATAAVGGLQAKGEEVLALIGMKK